MQAHVKWFVEYDITKPPMPIGEVLNGMFVQMFLVSVVGVYLFFLADRYIYEGGYLAEFDKKLKLFDNLAAAIMRAAAGIFFLSLFIWYLVYGTTFFLTPELKTSAGYVPWIHLLMALSVLSCRTTPITGIGIFFMYVAAALDYGIFHVLDYMIFLGIGYYLMTANSNSKSLIKSGFVVLFACTGLTLIWASVEKFAVREKPANADGNEREKIYDGFGFYRNFCNIYSTWRGFRRWTAHLARSYVYFRSCRPSIRSC